MVRLPMEEVDVGLTTERDFRSRPPTVGAHTSLCAPGRPWFVQYITVYAPDPYLHNLCFHQQFAAMRTAKISVFLPCEDDTLKTTIVGGIGASSCLSCAGCFVRSSAGVISPASLALGTVVVEGRIWSWCET
jgi:hypothetical protein